MRDIHDQMLNNIQDLLNLLLEECKRKRVLSWVVDKNNKVLYWVGVRGKEAPHVITQKIEPDMEKDLESILTWQKSAKLVSENSNYQLWQR